MSSSISVSGHEMKTSELNSLVAISSGIGPLSRINYDVKGRSGANAMSSGFCLTEFHLGMKLWEIGAGGPMETLGRGKSEDASQSSPTRVWVGTFHWYVGRISCCPLQPLMNVLAVLLTGIDIRKRRRDQNGGRPCHEESDELVWKPSPPEKRLETGRLYLVQTPPNVEPVIRRTSDGCLNSTLCFSLRL